MTRAERSGFGLGTALCALSLLLVLIEPRATLAGWLAAFVFWSGIPIGALGLVMMIRLIPGSWGVELAAPAETTLLFLPVATIAAFPILIGVHVLYGWAAEPVGEGFRGIYLTSWFFVLRTLLAFAVMIILSILLLAKRSLSVPVASIGLIIFVLFATLMATDWIMSLDDGFHSSGFGLYVLCMQITTALAALIGAQLLFSDRQTEPKLFGALMLTALLFWAYFAFMQFFIIWSGNFPPEVTWYRHHGEGIWSVAEYLVAALNLVPLLLLLLFPQIRRNRHTLLGLAASILIGRSIECAWLVLASVKVDLPMALSAAVLAFFGLGLLFVAGFLWSTRNVHRNVPVRHAGG